MYKIKLEILLNAAKNFNINLSRSRLVCVRENNVKAWLEAKGKAILYNVENNNFAQIKLFIFCPICYFYLNNNCFRNREKIKNAGW